MPTQIQIQTEAKTVGDKKYTLITLDGQIDESNLVEFGKVIEPLVGSATPYLVFNLAKLEFINSKVIGYLAAVHGKLTETNQQMLFAAPNQNILDILELVGLTQIVPTFENEEKAIATIKQGEI
jgi:anti-anti-sigma factor